jgi:hypothetical protein
MYKMIIAFCSALFSLSFAFAEPIERPNVKPEDKWAYNSTTEQAANQRMQTPSQWTQKHFETTVVRAGAMNILVSRKERASNQPPLEVLVGPDWSVSRSLDAEVVVISRPLKFPLTQGNSWELEYTENRPNKQLKSAKTHLNYTVVGWEEVEVPAGKFKAIKIEAVGKWISELEPSLNTATNTQTNKSGTTVIMQTQKEQPRTSSGQIYRAYWYVPDIKIYVKSIDENYFSSGALNRRTTEELESYKVSQ